MVMDSSDVTKTQSTIKLTEFIDNYWYHTVHWIDMNNDGKKDILTSRGNQTAGGGQLVWFEQPASNPLNGDMWTEHVITSGPDVFTSIETLVSYPNEVIVWSPQIKDERFVVYRVSLTDGTLVDSRIIDDNDINLAGDGKKIGRAYSMTLVDLNGDGNK